MSGWGADPAALSVVTIGPERADAAAAIADHALHARVSVDFDFGRRCAVRKVMERFAMAACAVVREARGAVVPRDREGDLVEVRSRGHAFELGCQRSEQLF